MTFHGQLNVTTTDGKTVNVPSALVDAILVGDADHDDYRIRFEAVRTSHPDETAAPDQRLGDTLPAD